MRNLSVMLSTAGCLVSLAISSPALAQSEPSSSSENSVSADGEITVTARKRQESILKVPVVTTVLTAEAIERFQTVNLQSLTTKVPGMLLGNGTLSIGTQISLRGIGTSSLDAGIDQSVSLNIDGVQMSQGLAFKSGLFDLAQAEILKGPQALFFGKNSPGGVVSLRTADPGSTAEIIARAGYEFEARERRGELILSGPLTDTFGVRLAGLYAKSDGFFYNDAVATPGKGGLNPRSRRYSPSRNYIVRGTAVWKPDPTFDARLKVNFANDHTDGNADPQYSSCPDGVGTGPAGTNFFGLTENCKLDRHVNIVDLDPASFPGIPHGGVPYAYINHNFGSLELNFRPRDDLTLTSVTGYSKNSGDLLASGTVGGSAGSGLAATNDFSRRDVTEEVRLDSDFRDSPINFTLGGFYQNGRIKNHIVVIGNTALGLPPSLGNGTHDVKIESESLFGQLRFKPSPVFEIAAGVRWANERRSDDPRNLVAGSFVPVATPVKRISSNNWSPELTLTFTPTDDLTIFGSLKQGYKSGSFSITTPAVAGVDNSFDDEKVQGAELGIKFRSPNRSLRVNVATYYYKYTGLQVGANEPPPPGSSVPVLRTLNAGAAQIYGVDFDVNYRPPSVPELNLHASVNWNHARFTDLTNVPCWGGQLQSEGCNLLPNATTGRFTSQDLSGEPLVRAPNWQANFGFDYSLPVGRDMKLNISSDNVYSSRYLADLLGRSDMYQSAFLKADATVALQAEDDSWEVALIGNNIGNRITAGNCTNFNGANGVVFGGLLTGGTTRGPAGVDEVGCMADRGRSVWVRLTLRPLGLLH